MTLGFNDAMKLGVYSIIEWWYIFLPIFIFGIILWYKESYIIDKVMEMIK